MEDGSQCFCGNTLPSSGYTKVAGGAANHGQCNKKCPNCGNWWKVSVYENKNWAALNKGCDDDTCL